MRYFASSRRSGRHLFANLRADVMRRSNSGSSSVRRYPPGTSVRQSVSPSSTLRRATTSLLRISALELPTLLTLSLSIAAPVVITDVKLGKDRLAVDRAGFTRPAARPRSERRGCGLEHPRGFQRG